MFKNSQISSLYILPTWLIPAVTSICFLYISYRYIVVKIKEDKLEGEIISIVNHTFRTPLTNILWHTSELKKDLPQNQKFLYLQNINNATSKVLDVVDVLVGIKDVKNTSGYFFQATSIREIVEESIKRYREKINKKNIKFQVSTFNDIPLLTLDLKKISFVIDSVLENAISYTKQEGKILVDCISDSQKLIIFISDTGIGLNKLDKMMIFSKFYRSKEAKLMDRDGMGLKLYLSRQIIQRHDGRIYAKSNGPDEGTTIFIELPFRK
jgi:signal transduction histidine kinase